MKTRPYLNGLFRCDWNCLSTIGKTRKEARDAMIKIKRSFNKIGKGSGG